MTDTQEFTFDQKLRALEHAIKLTEPPQFSVLGQLEDKAFDKEMGTWLKGVKAFAYVLLRTASEI